DRLRKSGAVFSGRESTINRLTTLCCAGAAALLLSFATPAYALYGKLTTPSVAFAKGYPAASQAQVMAALKRPDSKFLGGHFLNAWTSLRYGGNTRALNLFLDDLVKCPGVTVHVGFKQLPDDTDWRVGHMASGNRFQVEVNLSSERLNIEELYIPELHAGTK
ncbi:MAG TPA: hypothetical protein VK689_07390, partial [Armatimonadota bacterium]|nr:hypothetical protein [Armatimonadota bacterium]